MTDAGQETMRIPVKASYVIENGKAVRVAAEYAEINVDAFARYLIRGFGLMPPELLSSDDK